ncbi:hypothetical protein WNY37_04210 [Henriciella sp. AS95]|uniref:hypothetical protein n=1 Tax=Henriciella sp. AS95 TaxID=3135782 RepID=UPI0031757806
MKAAVFASVVALSFTGVACSEKAPAESGTAANVSAETASAPAASEFNLRYPGSESTTASDSSGGFNLRIPDAGAPQEGIRLPDGAINENRLADIPEIETPATEVPPAETDPDDEIIRLD